MEIKQISNDGLSLLIKPDFIYNRYDLCAQEYLVLCVCDKVEKFYMTVGLYKSEAKIGIWLMQLPEDVIVAVIEYIFDNFKWIRRISYTNGFTSRGLSWESHHYRIELPETIYELHARLSKKGRYNIKREKDIIARKFGSCILEEYTADNCPLDIIDTYFHYKYVTHHKDYGLTPSQYLNQFYVTNIYVLRMGDNIGAVILSCEQCENIYLENLSYDRRYGNLSCGQVLYDMYLSRLIEKGRKSLYLAGGDLDYKKRYGSIEERTSDCKVYRNKIVENILKLLLIVKHFVKW